MRDVDVFYYDIDDFRLDESKGKLYQNGLHIPLAHKAFQTLHILVRNAGRVVEKEDLYNELWSDSFVEEANLTQYIYLLRKIFPPNAAGDSYIQTVPRRGYVFSGKVDRIRASLHLVEESANVDFPASKLNPLQIGPRDSEVTWPNLELLTEGEAGKNEDANIDRNQEIERAKQFISDKRRVLRNGLYFVALLLAIILSIFLFRAENKSPTEPTINSIAVLPFQPIGEETRDKQLGFGMADAIITRLSNLHQIPVRPSSSVFKYIDEPVVNYATAGTELGVESVLEGTIQRDGDRVRVSVQLFKVADGKSIWAEKFDEKYTDVFALQDSIANKVVHSLALKLTPQQLEALEERPTNNAEALEAYQMGIYYWNTRTKENLQKAEANFQKAIELDPNFARAYAMLADTYNMTGYYNFADRTDMRAKASAAVAKALTLDDTVAEAHIANAFIQFTPTGAELANVSIERAIELAPYNSTARLRHAWILLRLGNLAEAAGEMKRAREYDPLSPLSNDALCTMLTYEENFEEAVNVCRRTLELSPATANHRLALANAMFFNGDIDQAIALTKMDIHEGNRKFNALGELAYFYARLGRQAEAESILTEIISETGKDPTLFADLAIINYALGDHDKSFAYFQRAYEKKVISVSAFNYDPVWKEVRGDARFAKMMEE